MSVRVLLAALALELAGFVVAGLVIVDLRLHLRFEQVAGFNVQGYRGPIQPRRVADERRLLLVGDSTAFGYGVGWPESFGFYLRNRLAVERNRIRAHQVVTLINAATISGGAYAFRAEVDDYGYLDPDIVIIDAGYDGLCDACPEDRRVWRHQSALFQAVGYMPILPLSLQEKSALLVRRPSAVARLAGGVMAVAGRAAAAVDRAGSEARPSATVGDPGCGARWASYCESIQAAVTAALLRAKGVVVVTPPYLSDRHRDQQAALTKMLQRQFGAGGRVVHLDDGGAVDLRDPVLSFDGVHLTARGNQRLAESLMPPLRELLDRW